MIGRQGEFICWSFAQFDKFGGAASHLTIGTRPGRTRCGIKWTTAWTFDYNDEGFVGCLRCQRMRYMSWTQLDTDGEGYFPMDTWGKDHWSTFVYAEHCANSKGGILNNNLMRCNPRLHREFANDNPSSDSPTRMKDGVIDRHDDWSCLEDIAAAGLITAFFRRISETAFGNSEARVEFTAAGIKMALQIRVYHDAGGHFSTFVPVADYNYTADDLNFDRERK